MSRLNVSFIDWFPSSSPRYYSLVSIILLVNSVAFHFRFTVAKFYHGIFLPPTNEVCGKVMFWVHREGSHVTHYPSCIGPYCTRPPIQGSSPNTPLYKAPVPPVQDSGPDPLLVTRDWRPVQTCSLQDLTVQALLVLTSGGWLLKHVSRVSGLYTSYWNAFL